MRASHGHNAAVVVVLLLLAAAAAAAAVAKQLCHPGDLAALLAVKAGFPNASYVEYWTPDVPCCEWYGVTCDDADDYTYTGRVVSLAFLRDANLTGPIPGAAIARLTRLSGLVFLHVPGVSGAIPPALARASGLTGLTISRTGVSGAIPASLGALAVLVSLDLSFNALAGAIPASLGSLPHLSTLDLSRNRLTGAIPPLLLSNAGPEAFLSLSHNGLCGGIPAEFAGVNFVQADLSRNNLTGDASVMFGRGSHRLLLDSLDLSRNNLSFDMSKLEFPPILGYLDMSHNKIHGSIPAQMGNVSQFVQFNVSYNRLCGEVPRNMASLDVYSFQHNKCLCGAPLPACHALHQ